MYLHVRVVEKSGGSEASKTSADDDNCRGCTPYPTTTCGHVRKSVKIGTTHPYAVDAALPLGIRNIL